MMLEVPAFDYSCHSNPGDIRGGMRTKLHTISPNIALNLNIWSKAAKNELKKQTDALDKLDQN